LRPAFDGSRGPRDAGRISGFDLVGELNDVGLAGICLEDPRKTRCAAADPDWIVESFGSKVDDPHS
jgi:hypothetical protein